MLKKDTFRSKIDLENNPFVKAFPNMEAAKIYLKKAKMLGRTAFYHEIHGDLVGDDLTLNLIVEEVFNITLCKNPPSFNKGESHLVYQSLEDVSNHDKLTMANIDIVGLVLMERLLLEDPSSILSSAPNHSSMQSSHVVEKRSMCYLFECYRRLQKIKETKTYVKQMSEVINKMTCYVVQHASTAFYQPFLYENQSLCQQVRHDNSHSSFFYSAKVFFTVMKTY